jgi:RNA polymerase sigma-70 factor, ECF subfamily
MAGRNLPGGLAHRLSQEPHNRAIGHRSVSQEAVIHDLYASSYRRLVLQLYPLTGDLGEAQEVVQEAFVRLLAKPRRAAALDNPEAWLRTVAVNLARGRWRRRRVLQRLLPRIDAAPAEVPGATPDHVALMAALRTLPAGQREAIALYHLADLPVTEVAEILQVSEGTVKSRLSRGRAALAGLLDESITEPGTRPLERSAHHA